MNDDHVELTPGGFRMFLDRKLLQAMSDNFDRACGFTPTRDPSKPTTDSETEQILADICGCPPSIARDVWEVGS